MRSQTMSGYDGNFKLAIGRFDAKISRPLFVAGILMLSLFAFEMFNFDTTRFALSSLLGDEKFLWFQWATILAIAFCSIDFAGLVRLFTPQKGMDEPKEVWYLMGAWLLGATMNAVMTWWAVSLTLLNHDFGNEVLSRAQLLAYVPIFVAVLVWLTRILFIGAFTIAGEQIFDLHGEKKGQSYQEASSVHTSQSAHVPQVVRAPQRAAMPKRSVPQVTKPMAAQMPSRPFTRPSQPARATAPVAPIETIVTQPRKVPSMAAGNGRATRPSPPSHHPVRKVPKVSKKASRIRQRPPMPNGRVRRTD